jgi:hypothetical protein
MSSRDVGIVCPRPNMLQSLWLSELTDPLLCSFDHAALYDSCKRPTWRTVLFSYMFIPSFYMFRAFMCSSSGELIVSIRHPVYVTVCRWPCVMQVWVEPLPLPSSVHKQTKLQNMTFSHRNTIKCRSAERVTLSHIIRELGASQLRALYLYCRAVHQVCAF